MTGPALNGPVAHQPFIVAGDQPGNVARTGTIGLAGRRYVLDPTKGFVRETLEMRKASQDQGGTTGQQSLTDAGLWHRSQIDWTLGAGQPHFDRPNSSDRRFLKSKGVDPWTAGELSLLNEVEVIGTSGQTNMFMLSVNGILYVCNGPSLHMMTNPLAATPIWSPGASLAAGARGITTDGAHVYVITDVGVYRTLIGSNSPALWSSFQGGVIAYSNGRLLAANGGHLVEIDAAGVAGGDDVLDYTHPNASFQWTAIAGAPNAIYCSGHAGDKSEVYAVLPNTNTGGLRVPVFADATPDGETLHALAHYGSFMVYGTSKGVRCAQISGNAALIHGPAIEIPGGVHCFEPQGESIWFEWSNYDQTSTGLGRLGLGELTEPLVPAYASDLMLSGQGRVVSICTIGDKRFFTVGGVGTLRQADTLVAAGTLDGGEIAWSTFAMKSAAAMDLRHAPLAGRVVASTLDEAGITQDAGASEGVSTLGPQGPFLLSGVHGEALHPLVRLERADTTHGPTLRRWTLSAVVRPKRQDRYTLPIILASTAKDVDNVEYHYDTEREMRFLKSIEATGQLVQLQIGGDTRRVQIDRIVQTEVDDWNDARTDFEGTVFVIVITQEAGI